MIKAFFFVVVFCGLFLFSPAIIHAQSPGRTQTVSGGYSFSGPWYQGQDVTYQLYQWELDKIVNITARKIGTDPIKIWTFYKAGDVSIYAGVKPGQFQVEVRFGVAGGSVIILIEVD